jgi:hypothetical protein
VTEGRDLLSELTGHWYNSLGKYDVRFPTSKVRKLQLMCLYEYYPNPVSQDMMAQWILQKEGENDRQARHLAWDGWYLQTGNRSSSRMEINPNLANDELRLVSLEVPNPIWQKHHQNMLELEQKHPGFGKILRKYKSRGCFMCGMKAKSFSPYSDFESDTYQFDVIPLCEECNDWCNTRNIALEVSDNLVARTLINNDKTKQQRSISAMKGAEKRRLNIEKREVSVSSGHTANSLDLPHILEEILSLQPMFSSLNTPEMQRRGILIRKLAPSAILPWAEKHGLSTEGRDGTGRKTRVPWFRAHSKIHSPKATTGWYVVFLFTFDGSVVYFSLNQGTTDFIDKQFIPKSSEELASRVLWARQTLGIANESKQPRFVYDLDLRDRGTLAKSYALGNVVSFKYDANEIPEADDLRRDFDVLVGFLNILQGNTEQNSESFGLLMRNNTEGSKAETKCGHTIKVTAVKKNGGHYEGQWSISVRGPRVTGKSGRKTIYCRPSIYYVIRELLSFFGAFEIISPENGIEEIVPR